MSLARKFHKRPRVVTGTSSRAVGGWGSVADSPVPSVEKDKGYPKFNYTAPDSRDYSDNESYYENPSSQTPPLKVPSYVPDQPVNRIPDFSDSDEEAEFTAKVEAYYRRTDADKRNKAPVRLTAPKRKITELLSDDEITDDDNVDVKEEEEEDEEAVPTARSIMINNLVDLLEMTGITLNFVIKLRGVDVDPTDLEQVREALNDYLKDENKPLETPAEDAAEHAEAMIERLFDMPLREFLPLAYDIANFRDELEEQGISLNQE
ncbi:hypothetical protein F5Y00DRAFT_155794 [Daldinia vernicosa]|uniref:uncharacterized protein n=1 Tax=Daldinia vernicosa TaxID=114800 RepID=UPI002008CB99|nr:uncharacterized protein F5Y00DRAFT_155794 [Daldinia vernicosa]KAI0852860.1 hypothetical protein F5Y00DRAFT_155794 [Daldinia vernicosa]